MTLHTEWVNYGESQTYTGYLARHKLVSNNAPVVIVIQEIWGVDPHIQNVTRRFAEAGYIAFSPDLYSRNGERMDALTAERIEEVKSFLEELPPSAWGNPSEREQALAKYSEDKQARITETQSTLFGGLDPENYIKQLLDTTGYLRSTYAQNHGIGSVGFCLGGGLSAALATRDPELRGAIIFYGAAPKEEAIPDIQCPILGFYGEKDPRITGAVPELAENMRKQNKSFEYKIYEGAEHAFFNDSRRSYNPAAARDAFTRTLQFFNEVL